MRSNTEIAKDLLLKAHKLLDGNALGDARYRISMALQEIEKVESKREKRKEVAQTIANQWKDKVQQQTNNLISPRESLEMIDKMIEDEKKKLEKKEEPKDLRTLLD
ncbi:MAG: hypothetical protein DWQ19_12365 [Crenarchaeota archaeon]|nr:MAG: hypothetical protein DWQ19_12365 [Thermoproteota archaeon]